MESSSRFSAEPNEAGSSVGGGSTKEEEERTFCCSEAKRTFRGAEMEFWKEDGAPLGADNLLFLYALHRQGGGGTVTPSRRNQWVRSHRETESKKTGGEGAGSMLEGNLWRSDAGGTRGVWSDTSLHRIFTKTVPKLSKKQNKKKVFFILDAINQATWANQRDPSIQVKPAGG